MKKVLLALFMAVGVTSAYAQLSGNLGLTSDYRFRGISQTQNAPAIQGGIDYAHSSGLYIGNWNSSVSSQMYNNGSGVVSFTSGNWRSTAAINTIRLFGSGENTVQYSSFALYGVN